MKIEDLFRQKLQTNTIKPSKNIWKKLDSRLQANPNINHSSLWQSMTLQIKTIVISSSCLIASTAGYLVYDFLSEQRDDTTNTIVTNTINKEVITKDIVDTPERLDNITSSKQDTLLSKNKLIKDSVNNNYVFDTKLMENEADLNNVDNSVAIEPINTIVPNSTITQNKIIKQYPKNNTNFEPRNSATENKNLKLTIPNVITPNGDGVNDCLTINNIEMYPDNVLVIYSRNSKIVYQKQHYSNEFCGQNLPKGAYFYSFRVRYNAKIYQYNGSLTIIR